MDNIPRADSFVPAVKLLAVTASAFLAGGVANYTLAVVPSIIDAPERLLASQWQKAYLCGFRQVPPQALVRTRRVVAARWPHN